MSCSFAPQWTVRIDYQAYQDLGEADMTGEFDMDRIRFGVLYRF
jgi:opacity protein-like surface antigen